MLDLLDLLRLLAGLDHGRRLSHALLGLETVELLLEDTDLVLEIAYLSLVSFNLSGLQLALGELCLLFQ